MCQFAPLAGKPGCGTKSEALSQFFEGTAGDVTDEEVRFTTTDKSSREKELEKQLQKETDRDRGRTISRELDSLRPIANAVNAAIILRQKRMPEHASTGSRYS